MPIPVDTAYDFASVTPDQVQIGRRYLFTQEVAGRVNTINMLGPDTYWFLMTVLTVDGGTASGSAQLPTGQLNQQTIGNRYYAWRRQPRPELGALFTLGDGSKWIHCGPTEKGSYQCYLTGTTHTEGAWGSRAQMTGTDWLPPELDADPAVEWVPVRDGANVAVGSTYIFLNEAIGEVVAITPGYPRWSFEITKPGGGTTITYAHDATVAQRTGVRELIWLATPKPAPDAKFLGPGGSKWIYPGNAAGTYRCWAAGGVYTLGAVYLRGDITGGLKPLA